MLRIWLFIICAPLMLNAGSILGETTQTKTITFPADDGAHNELMEWWYWTGHLFDGQGNYYGFQKTYFLFKIGFIRGKLVNVAITDEKKAIHEYDAAFKFGFKPKSKAGKRFKFALGKQWAQWGNGFDTLHGVTGSYQYDLTLKPLKPVILNHGNGFHRYPFGGYTWYYSRTRLAVEGKLTVDGKLLNVTGTAWFDHQWGDLEKVTEIGWDWFAIQLDDGSDIMLFMSKDNQSGLLGGTWVDKEGISREINPKSVDIQTIDEWTSPLSGFVYPMGWKINIEGVDLLLTPIIEEQEMYSKKRPERSYWEGAVVVTGDITGRGYVELTGYNSPVSTEQRLIKNK